MAIINCNISNTFPKPLVQFENFPNLAKQFLESINSVFEKLVTTLDQFKLTTVIQSTLRLQKQMLGFLPKEKEDYYSRLYLRSLCGLPPMPIRVNDNIQELKGAISGIVGKKINVTDMIRDLRD